MNSTKGILLGIGVIALMGCVSQQAHEKTMEELEATKNASSHEIERLQQLVNVKQATADQLQEENLDLERSVNEQKTVVVELQEKNLALGKALNEQEQVFVQLQETKEELEKKVEAQDRVNQQRLNKIQQEINDLYQQMLALNQAEDLKTNTVFDVNSDNIDFDELTQAFEQLKAMLDAQVADFSSLWEQNQRLEQELINVEARLKEMERLKQELKEVRQARAIQEVQLAKVKHEVLTVGEEIDRITKALEEKFGKSLVVTQHHDRLILTVLGQVLFDSGEADLTPLGLKIMRQVGQVLATLPEKYIQVEGHTDNNPIYGQLQQWYPTNWELSTARATTVLRYLIEQSGMNPKQFSAMGYADTRPVKSNETEEGRAQNRRVEIVLYPEPLIPQSEKVATLSPP